MRAATLHPPTPRNPPMSHNTHSNRINRTTAPVSARQPKLRRSPVTQAWYYNQDGKNYGPVSPSQLRQLATSGQLVPTDMLWRQGMKEWVPAGTLLGFPAPPTPPAAPTPAAPARTFPWVRLTVTLVFAVAGVVLLLLGKAKLG